MGSDDRITIGVTLLMMAINFAGAVLTIRHNNRSGERLSFANFNHSDYGSRQSGGEVLAFNIMVGRSLFKNPFFYGMLFLVAAYFMIKYQGVYRI